MKKEQAITFGIVAGLAILALGYFMGKNTRLTNASVVVQTNKPPVVLTTNTPPSIAPPTNAPAQASQIDLLAAEVKALKTVNEEREAMVNRLFKLNEEVQRERATVTNHITVPINITVTNTSPAVNINGTLNIGGSSVTKKVREPKTRVPMYVVTNSTSSVTTTGTNTTSVVNTQTQSFLKPGRRWSVMGFIFGEKDPIPTTVPSGQSIQQGYPPTPVIVVEQPTYYYGGYPYGYGYPYQRVPVYNQSCERRLFGVRFHTR